jgi:autotransporter-associated beta strand protein
MNLPTMIFSLRRTALLVAALVFGVRESAFAAAEADLLIAYDNSYSDGVGGDANAEVALANSVGASNWINFVSGTPARMRVAGYHKTWWQGGRTSLGGFVSWMGNYGDGNLDDVTAKGDALGADLIAFVCAPSAGETSAAVAYQPGRYAAYGTGNFWNNVVAHESGGHNYGCDHRVGRENPKTIMMHNYCGGGSQGYFSNPNIWLNGTKLLGEGSCLGAAVQGGDAGYLISNAAQGVADRNERLVYGSNLYPIVKRWKFNKPAGAAPAGTVIGDDVGGAQAIVRGQGATFTGNGLQLPGGTSGNTAANSIAAYIDLPNGTFSSMPNFTIEIWATPLSAQNWMRVIEIGRTTQAGDGLGAAGEYTGTPGSAAPGGTDPSDNITLTAARGVNLGLQRFEAKLDGANVVTADSDLGTTAGQMHHYAITFADTATGGTITWYRDGALIKSINVAFHASQIEDVNNWLGRSMWSGDAMSHMEYHDVRLQSIALNAGNIGANYLIGPNDAKATLWANDAWGNSGFVNGPWEFGNVPNASRDYETGKMRLLSPYNFANNIFPGKSLTITGGSLYLVGRSSTTTTVNDLRLNGGSLIQLAEGGGANTQTLAGNLTVSNINQVNAQWGPVAISSNITGFGTLLYTGNQVTLSATNTGFTGQTVIGDGRFSSLRISKEENLGGNPPWFGGAWLELNRGILVTTQTMTIDDPNRGIEIGPSGGIFSPWANTSLTIATPITCDASGDTLRTAPFDSNPIAGIFVKDDWGQLNLTNPNNSHNGEIQILRGELMLSGNGRLNNGDHWMPFTNNGLFTCNSNLDQTVRGVISGTGSLIKGGNGTLYLPTPSTLSGAVTVNGGTLYANPGNAATNRIFSYVSSITINGGTLRSTANGLFGWDGTQEKSITVNAGGTLTADGNADVGVGNVTLAGGTLASLAPSAAWGSWRFDQATDVLNVTGDSTVSATNVKFGNAAAAINVSPGKTLNFTGTVTDATAGGISYLTKTGTGVLTLAGVNTHTGATAVNEGTLNLTGSLGATAVSVASGATLKGAGSIGGNVTLATNAIHTPGTGTQAIGGAASYANGSRFKWTLSTNSNSAGAASRANVSGTVTVTSGAAIDLVLNGAGSSTNYFDTFWTQARSWTVVSSNGGMTGQFTLGNIGNDAQGQVASTYGSFSLTQNSSGATLQWTPKAFAAWRGTNFGANATNAATSNFGSDPDKDGLVNAWEYFHATNPSANTSGQFQARIENNRVKLTFPRNVFATDALVKIQAAESPAGPWTDLAQSSGGTAFSPIVGGATVSESGSGQTRAVEFNDLYLTTDPAYPKRFFRLWIQQQ